jgi:hypothetical protein
VHVHNAGNSILRSFKYRGTEEKIQLAIRYSGGEYSSGDYTRNLRQISLDAYRVVGPNFSNEVTRRLKSEDRALV